MGDEVMLAMAAAVAGKATEMLTRGAKDSVTALRKALRRRFAEGTPEREALDEARDGDGEDEVLVGRLAGHIRDAAERDETVRGLVVQVAPHFTEQDGDTVVNNNASGPVSGTLVQTGTIEGGVNIGRSRG